MFKHNTYHQLLATVTISWDLQLWKIKVERQYFITDSCDKMAFIVDWFQHPGYPDEVHAIALVDNGEEYIKALVRVVFPNYFYLLLEEEPDLKSIETLKHNLRGEASIGYKKVRTLFGYQPEPEVPALLVKCNDPSAIIKNRAFKAFGGIPAEQSVVTRSRKLTTLKNMPLCCWISLAGSKVIGEDSPQRASKNGLQEFRFEDWNNLSALPLDRKETFAPPPGSLIKSFSFDIEVYKSSERGGMPDAEEDDNVVLCISYVVQDGERGRYHYFLSIFDVPDKSILPPETVVKVYSSEKAMIIDFFEDIAKIDPTVIIGFNIHSWDFDYLHKRLVKHRVKFPLSLGVYKVPVPVKMHTAPGFDFTSYGSNIVFPSIKGIISIDLHKFFLKSRPKLKKHSLEYISRTFLGTGKHDMSQTRMALAYESKEPRELSLLAQYNVNDSVLVTDLFLKQNVFEEIAIEAIVSETLIEDLYTKGETTRAINQLYRFAKADGYVVTEVNAPDNVDKLKGGLVTEPRPGLYDDTAIFDIQSMYPSIMIIFNLCYSTYIRPDQLKLFKEGEYITLPWESSISQGGKGEVNEVHFVTDQLRVGVCKKMLSNRIALRNKIKEWVKEEEDKTRAAILNMIQKAVKLSSNSLIGLMAVSVKFSSKLAFHACAGAVYTKGRETISRVIEGAGAHVTNPPHGPVVYSDTDSIMIAGMGSLDARKQMLEWLNKNYAPFVFEFENVGRILIISSKNYIMRTDKGETRYVGVSFSKRGSCSFIADTMKEIVEMIMNGETKIRIMSYVKHRIEELPEESPDDLALTAPVGESERSLGRQIAKRLNANGASFQIGDTIDYVVLKGTKKIQPISQRVVSVDEFLANPEMYKIDYDYYSEHLTSGVDRLMVF